MAVFSKSPPAGDIATAKNIANYLFSMQEAIEYAMLQKDKRIIELEARIEELEGG